MKREDIEKIVQKGVLYRCEGSQHAVWQPDISIELYIPVVLQNPQLDILTIPVYHAALMTLGEAWQWHVDKLRDAVKMEHEAIDARNDPAIALLEGKAGPGIVKRPTPKPLILPRAKRGQDD